MVNFDYTSVTFGLIAEAPQWTSVAVLGAVTGGFAALIFGSSAYGVARTKQ